MYVPHCVVPESIFYPPTPPLSRRVTGNPSGVGRGFQIKKTLSELETNGSQMSRSLNFLRSSPWILEQIKETAHSLATVATD